MSRSTKLSKQERALYATTGFHPNSLVTEEFLIAYTTDDIGSKFFSVVTNGQTVKEYVKAEHTLLDFYLAVQAVDKSKLPKGYWEWLKEVRDGSFRAHWRTLGLKTGENPELAQEDYFSARGNTNK